MEACPHRYYISNQSHYRTLFIFQFYLRMRQKAAFINICTPWLLTKNKTKRKASKGFNKQIFFILFHLHKKKAKHNNKQNEKEKL